MSLDTAFRLKASCANCPFRVKGAIELRAGRVEGIVEGLLADDLTNFSCHKTVYRGAGKARAEDTSFCAGAMIVLEKLGRTSAAMRLGKVLGVYDPQALKPSYDDVIDPRSLVLQKKRPVRRKRRPTKAKASSEKAT